MYPRQRDQHEQRHGHVKQQPSPNSVVALEWRVRQGWVRNEAAEGGRSHSTRAFYALLRNVWAMRSQ